VVRSVNPGFFYHLKVTRSFLLFLIVCFFNPSPLTSLPFQKMMAYNVRSCFFFFENLWAAPIEDVGDRRCLSPYKRLSLFFRRLLRTSATATFSQSLREHSLGKAPTVSNSFGDFGPPRRIDAEESRGFVLERDPCRIVFGRLVRYNRSSSDCRRLYRNFPRTS